MSNRQKVLSKGKRIIENRMKMRNKIKNKNNG